MRIAIDLRPLMSGKISGVEIYILSMLEAIFKEDSQNEYILWYNAFGKVDETYFPKARPNASLKRTYFPNKIFNLSLSLLRFPKIDWLVGGADILWVPDLRPAPVSHRCFKITTFHDLSFEEFKHSFNRKTRLWHRLLRPRKEAMESKKIIAVSYFTKNQLTRLYRLPSSKVEVIHESAGFMNTAEAEKNKKSFEEVRAKYNLPEHYFLCLSTLEPRKNIKGVIQAYLEWKAEGGGDIKLVIAGKQHPSIFADISLEKYPDIHLTGFIEEEDKTMLYTHAKAFLYLSFYEGFGLPILEAMTCGTPVITSFDTCLPEIAGEAALLVNPQDGGKIKEALTCIIQEPLRSHLVEKGKERVSHFSWEKAAKSFLAVLKKVNAS